MSHSISDLQASYTVLHNHLGGLYAGRVYPDIAPAGAEYPLVVYGFQGGGETDRRKRENSTITLVIKCVSQHLEEAFAGSMLIGDLLRDQGSQEGNTLPSDPEWEITTVSQGVIVHMVEVWKENGQIFYHSGHQYTFTMERRS